MQTKTKQFSLSQLDILFLSVFGTGFAPKAPGTFGSIVAIIPLYILSSFFSVNFYIYTASILFISIIAVIYTHKIQNRYNLKDPSWIVIDEVIGMAIAWPFLEQHGFLDIIILLVFFRFFDIIKPWPASYFDNLKHAIGVILDDVVCALYAGFVYKLISFYFKF